MSELQTTDLTPKIFEGLCLATKDTLVNVIQWEGINYEYDQYHRIESYTVYRPSIRKFMFTEKPRKTDVCIQELHRVVFGLPKESMNRDDPKSVIDFIGRFIGTHRDYYMAIALLVESHYTKGDLKSLKKYIKDKRMYHY